MDEREVKMKNARDAIAVMTAWATHGSEDTFVKDTVVGVVTEREDLVKGFRDLAYGLVGLCGHLMTIREAETGKGYGETLQYLGSKYADE